MIKKQIQNERFNKLSSHSILLLVKSNSNDRRYLGSRGRLLNYTQGDIMKLKADTNYALWMLIVAASEDGQTASVYKIVNVYKISANLLKRPANKIIRPVRVENLLQLSTARQKEKSYDKRLQITY